MSPLFWAILLLALAISFIILEAFIPSAGLLSFFSLVSVIAAIIVAYRAGTWPGTIFMCGTAVLIPLVVALLIRWWPHTPLGKLILVQPPTAEDVVPESSLDASLLGSIGIASNRMLPSGLVRIEGRSVDAISEGMAIEKGAHVEVVGVRGNYVVVRPAKAETVFKAQANKLEPSPEGKQTTDFEDIISDPFGDDSVS